MTYKFSESADNNVEISLGPSLAFQAVVLLNL